MKHKFRLNNEFKNYLRQIQRKHGYSITKIAALLDVSVTTIHNWLNKTHEVKQIYLNRLKQILLDE